MDGSIDCQTEWSKSDREREISYIAYMWNQKNDTNELIYETETDSDLENQLMVEVGKGGREG